MDACVHLRLDLDPRVTPIAGWLTDGDGTRAAVSGWLGLVAAIDAAMTSARGQGPERDDARSRP